MKHVALWALALAINAVLVAVAAAGEIEATSEIDSVVVFPSGAEVNRAAKVSLPEGETTIVFGDLPVQTVPGSIRVEGEAAGALRIGSVDQRRLFVPQSGSSDDVTERKRLEKEIERLSKQRGVRRRLRTRKKLPVLSIIGYTNAGKSSLFNLIISKIEIPSACISFEFSFR